MALACLHSTTVLVLSAHKFSHTRATNNSLLSSGSLLPSISQKRHILFHYFPFQRAEQLLRYKYNRSTSLGMISKHQLSIYLLSSPLYNHTAPLLFLFLSSAELQAPQVTINLYHTSLWSRCERSERRTHQIILHSSDLVIYFMPGVLDIVSRF